MRVAFSIILNGVHHLTHNNYYQFILDNFDYWIVCEGASNNNGSTMWCKKMNESFHENGRSIDGTHEFLYNIINEKNFIYIPSNGMWSSKDEMVNKCIEKVKGIANNCILFQIDIDEQWTKEGIDMAESALTNTNVKYLQLYCNHYVGEGLVAIGKDWGANLFTRVFNWTGEDFLRHEPPILNTPNDTAIILNGYRFEHYSYYFEKDVVFKDNWYTNHEGVHKNWLKINSNKDSLKFPLHISELFPKFKSYDTQIFKIK